MPFSSGILNFASINFFMLVLYHVRKIQSAYQNLWFIFFTLFLLFATIFIFYLNWENSHRNLTFAVLDVGQGEALFIESPTGTTDFNRWSPPKNFKPSCSSNAYI